MAAQISVRFRSAARIPRRVRSDKRYYVELDRNWDVVALTEYVGGGGGNNGRIAERYAYTPYGEHVILKGDTGSGETAKAIIASAIASAIQHQGLIVEREINSYQNRYRTLAIRDSRFLERDPWKRYDSA